MVVAAGSTYHCCKKLEMESCFPHDLIELPTVGPPLYTAKDLKELRKLKLELLAQNSTSKASVYYTPPELQADDDFIGAAAANAVGDVGAGDVGDRRSREYHKNVMATMGQYRRRASPNHLQISPIHINYINENCSQSIDEFDYLRIRPQCLLNNNITRTPPPSIAIELNGNEVSTDDDEHAKKLRDKCEGILG